MGIGMITDLVLAEATEFIVAPAVFLHPFAGLKFAVALGLNLYPGSYWDGDCH